MNEFLDFHQELISEMAKAFGIPKEMAVQNVDETRDSMSRQLQKVYDSYIEKLRLELQEFATAILEEWKYNRLPFWGKVIYQIKKAYKEVYHAGV